MTTPIGRDFKRTRRGHGIDFEFSREFFVGLALGLSVAAGVFIWQQQQIRSTIAAIEDPLAPQPRPTRGTPAPETESDTLTDYDFYTLLPKAEVVIPENNGSGAAPVPNAPIERPGVYVLQPGAFRSLEEAERLRAKLSRLGIQSSLQRVADEVNDIHRVRVGPIDDLAALNRTRARLRAADIDALVIRVGD
jgi:cell division protein FtsN